jgi:uncharacterized protein YdaU (DUF1376 family)
MIGHNTSADAKGGIAVEAACDQPTKFRYLPLHIGDWLTGTEGLTFEHRGFYIDFLARLYNRGKPFPDDDRQMADIFGITIRVWKRLKAVLIEAGKILVRNCSLTNDRFEVERRRRADEIRRKSESAQARWEVSRQTSGKLPANFAETSPKLSPNSEVDTSKINGLAVKVNAAPLTVIVNQDKKERPIGLLFSDDPKTPDPMTASVAAREAFALYNETAKRCGLPEARALSKQRARALALRVKEAEGLDGFRKALANLERSAFLRGQNDRGWCADLDFICQPKSFSRLLEGGYGNGAGGKPRSDVMSRMYESVDI